MVKCSLVTWTVALSASTALAHPLFNGRVISRADQLLKEYDYVIVGAGASGLTVANRLSEQAGEQITPVRAAQHLLTSSSYDGPCHRSWRFVSSARVIQLAGY